MRASWGKVRRGSVPGIKSLLVSRNNAFGVDPGERRVAQITNAPVAGRISAPDVIPNLLIGLLALAPVLPFVQKADAAAPQAKIQVQCEQQSSRLPLGIYPNIRGNQLTGSAPSYRVKTEIFSPPNLLETTLAVTTQTPFFPNIAEAVKSKAEVRADTYPNNLVRGIPVPIDAGKISAPYFAGPQQKTPIGFADIPPNLLRRLLPGPLPVGDVLSDSVAQVKAAVSLDIPPNLLVRLSAPPTPFVQSASNSAPISKASVGVDGPQSLLQTTLATVANALPIGQRLHDSAPPPKYNIRAPLIPGQITQPTASAPLPIGLGVYGSAPYPKYQVQVDTYPNNLTLGIPTPAQVPAWADFDVAPAMSQYLGVFNPPNLLGTTLATLNPIPPGRQVFDSAPPPKSPVQVDKLRTDLALGIPVIQPPSLPLGLPIDVSQWMGKYQVVDLNYLWPNSQLPNTIPPPVMVPAPVLPPEIPAGRRVRHRPMRYIVRVDSQEFVCFSEAEALEVLRRAREAAALFSVEQIEKAAAVALKTQSQPVLPTLEPPRITVNSRDLRSAVSQTRREIAQTYRQAEIDAEIKMLFELKKRSDDDEDSLMLLM